MIPGNDTVIAVAYEGGQLEGLASSLVKARKARLLANAGMVAALGLPMKEAGSACHICGYGRQAHPENRADQIKKRIKDFLGAACSCSAANGAATNS